MFGFGDFLSETKVIKISIIDSQVPLTDFHVNEAKKKINKNFKWMTQKTKAFKIAKLSGIGLCVSRIDYC